MNISMIFPLYIYHIVSHDHTAVTGRLFMECQEIVRMQRFELLQRKALYKYLLLLEQLLRISRKLERNVSSILYIHSDVCFFITLCCRHGKVIILE